MHNQQWELADVFKAGFTQYCAVTGTLPKQHYDIANAIMACRTQAMGAHLFTCDHCGHEKLGYNSCRNRHCPSCQAHARAQWVERRTNELLDVPYFHVVFTIPDSLNQFALRNKAVFYALMFRAASETITELGANPKRLGANMGYIAVLHTWGQNLIDHPHIHCIVPAGGLREDQWIDSRNQSFLFPVSVMSALFRGKIMAYFREALADGSMELHGTLERYRDEPDSLRDCIHSMYAASWVVYAKPPFGGALAVVKYLGRYTHRIAIANSRIVNVCDKGVSFRWKDYRHGNIEKTMTLDIVEFIRRFMLHVIPKNFVRIRYYGFLSCRSRSEKLPLCRSLTATPDPKLRLVKAGNCLKPADDAMLCPSCRTGHMRPYLALHKPDPGGVLSIAA